MQPGQPPEQDPERGQQPYGQQPAYGQFRPEDEGVNRPSMKRPV